MANPAGEIGQLREEELPVVRVIVPPDPSGRVFEDDLDPGDLQRKREEAGNPIGRIPLVLGVCRVAQLAANDHSIPATPSLMEPDNARSNGPYSTLQHHPATRYDRLILKQVVGRSDDVQFGFSLRPGAPRRRPSDYAALGPLGRHQAAMSLPQQATAADDKDLVPA